MRRALLPLSFLLGLAAWTPAAARESLGVHEGWGVFRDATPARCFAIAEPVVMRRRREMAGWRPFAAITNWPKLGPRGQVHIRLRRLKRPGTPVMLAIRDRRFLLASGKAEAWAPDAAGDAAIVAAMRGAPSMSVEALDMAGRPFVDIYRLRGAATAIDAAALGCMKPR